MSVQNVSEDSYDAAKSRPLSDEEKNRPVPSTVSYADQAKTGGRLNDKARLHLRAYSRFCLWAMPLFDLGHVTLKDKLIEFSLLISKRFLLSKNSEGIPRIEFQDSEFAWVQELPWSQAAIHFKSKVIYLISKPEAPLGMMYFSIPIDLAEKLEIFKGKRYLELTRAELFNTNVNSKVIRLELAELSDGFATKKKYKHKM